MSRSSWRFACPAFFGSPAVGRLRAIILGEGGAQVLRGSTACRVLEALPFLPSELLGAKLAGVMDRAVDEGVTRRRGSIDPGVDIGHVPLKVADIDRSLAFYCDVLGFELQQRMGEQAAFLSAGGYHHHIGLNTWESRGGSPPPAGTTGLYHVAIRYPSRAALGDALRRLIAAGIPLEGASDHGVSEALYLKDPDSNGVELYRDRPQSEWPRTPDGQLAMVGTPLDLPELLREADSVDL